jgi:glyoxylase-like metal-dependent hydrolase (beta-lactamase superfamily II)
MKQEQEHARDDVTEVAPGVLRLQLPIDFSGLGHVNCYALVDDQGVAIVDPGLPGPGQHKVLRRRLADAGFRLRDVHTVLVTHSHPDHFGGAGVLAEKAGATVATHAAFRLWFSPHACDHEVDEVPDHESHLMTDGRTPWGGEGFRPPRGRRWMFRLARYGITPGYRHPRPGRRLRHGERLRLAGRQWQAVHTPGHTLDHLCLFDADAGVLLSGDHVLPTITPHISGVGTGRDPLESFLGSLERVRALPGVRTVLPAHGHPFDDLDARVEAIRTHHHERLDKLRAALADAGEPLTVTELSHALFRPAHHGPMAESETFAHMEHLHLAGEATVERRGERLCYRAATRTSPT